jgi:hypothetical protein
MDHESSARFTKPSDDGGHCGGSGEGNSPLQARASFLQNWNWESVIGLNRRVCAGGGAQHGANPETFATCQSAWESRFRSELSLQETYQMLREFHRSAPFLFFNGNTFAYIGREMSLALFSDLPATRKRAVASSVAHYISGVMDWEMMALFVKEMAESSSIAVGDPVATLKGTLKGIVTNILPDGRIQWRSESDGALMISLPETLKRIL